MDNIIKKIDLVTQAVLPLVYDDSLSYYEFLCKVLDKLNEVIDSDDLQNKAIEDLNEEIEDWEETTDEKYDEFKGQMEDLYEEFTKNFVSEYSESKTYYKGDYVYYDEKLYRCTATTTSGVWDSDDWLDVVLADDLKTMQDVFEDSMLGQWEDFLEDYVQTLGIVQVTGDSTTHVMSQKAVTDELNDVKEDISKNTEDIEIDSKQLYNLYEMLKDTAYEMENGDSPVYSQDVPQNACKYADIQMIGGATIEYNQKVRNGDFGSTQNWNASNCNTAVNNNVCTCTITSISSNTRIQQTIRMIQGHTYFYTVTMQSAKATRSAIGTYEHSSTLTKIIQTFNISANTLTKMEGIFTSINNANIFRIYLNRDTDLSVGDSVDLKNAMLFDLTLLFGIGNEPSTVEEFKALYPNDYYAYSVGTLVDGKCDKIVSLDSTDTQIQEYTIPSAIQNMPNYGCSNGDTVYNEVNIKNKKYIQRIDDIDLGMQTWTYDNSNGFSLFTTTLDYLKIPSVAICGLYLNHNVISITDLGNKEFSLYEDNGNYVVAIRDDSYTSASDFTMAMDGVMLYYELQTPQEIDISSYLTDDNYIATSQGGSLIFHQTDSMEIEIPNIVKYTIKL